MSLEAGLLKLQQRARIAKALILAYIVLSVMTIATAVASVTGHVDLNSAGELDTISTLAGMGVLVEIAIFIVSAIVVSMWIHRAHENLVTADIEGLEFTPGWSVGWFFVPIANLVKPFQAMRELWIASHGGTSEAPSPLIVWWAGYLLGGMLKNVSSRLSDEGSIGYMLDMAGSIALIVSATFLLKIIREITATQSSGLAASEIFA